MTDFCVLDLPSPTGEHPQLSATGDSSNASLGCHFAGQTLLPKHIVSPARSHSQMPQAGVWPSCSSLFHCPPPSACGISIPEGEHPPGFSERGFICSDAFQEVFSSPNKLGSLIFLDGPQLQFPLPGIFPSLRVLNEPSS